ncbi:MAG: nickel pincer cofactor biosynthesis protein LarC [candidate division Zixibacteria bacterium]|nr:nickel pincer cofactor biosynthesis protein LarC [candidate division Zixibacteria bacterium]
MMKTLIFDPFSGCAGDMILGAMVSAGVDFGALKSELKKLNLGNYTLEKSEVMRHHISSVKVDVKTGEEHAHRHLKDIYEIIDKSSFGETIKDNARRIFSRLADAESVAHNTSPEKIHFHEVGAVDAIVDIVGSCVAIEMLGVEKVYSRPISLGGGFIKAAHGNMPVPAPATAELVKGFPTVFRKVNHELTTPTGAAVITTLAKPLQNIAEYEIESIGYGAGSRDLEELPNFLRVFVADPSGSYEYDKILQIETNIDNQNPEVFSFIFEGLFELGAKDLFTVPIQMKKNRPGTLLTVLCSPDDKDKMTEFIFANSTTSGMRYCLLDRTKLKRSSEMIETSFGPVKTKVYHFAGKERYYPEYEDLKRLAFEHKISIIDLNHKLQFEIKKIKEF